MSRPIRPKPRRDPDVWLAVETQANWRWHVHDSFDQLCLLDVRPSLVAAVEFGPTETITRLKDGRQGG